MYLARGNSISRNSETSYPRLRGDGISFFRLFELMEYPERRGGILSSANVQNNHSLQFSSFLYQKSIKTRSKGVCVLASNHNRPALRSDTSEAQTPILASAKGLIDLGRVGLYLVHG